MGFPQSWGLLFFVVVFLFCFVFGGLGYVLVVDFCLFSFAHRF